MFFKQFQIGVRDRVGAAKTLHFSKGDIRHIYFQAFSNPFQSFKPYQFHRAGLIDKSGNESFRSSFSCGFDMRDFTNDLYIGAGGLQLTNRVILCFVNIAVGKEVKQILIGVNAQF